MREKKGEKKHKIPSYMHNMILISFAFTPFQWVLCSTFVHGELFSFVHEYGMRGERERVSKQKQEISAWKNIIILILRIFTSGKNSQRSCILYDRRWRRYGVDNRFSRVHERENECEREKETLSWQREAHGVSGWTLVEYFQF